MKYDLGSKPTEVPQALGSRVWYPTVSLKSPTSPKLKVGDAVCGEIEGIVRGISKDPQTGEFCCELELHEVEVERDKSAMEKAGY
jgi:hypothetical protein